ncbi:MAG TPA: YafY family protein [Chthonomonadaceae bacterium]|nr:YafY family protein [Chthonomonadaceae bacterium]
MNRTERLTAILMLLQERGRQRRRTAEEIAARFEVSRRTILRDIQALCEMGVPVYAQEGVGGGYSLPSDYTLPPLPLSLREAVLMLLSLNTLDSLADTPFAPERASLLAKLRVLLPAGQRAEAERWMQTLAIEVPQRQYTVPFVEMLLESAREARWVQATYRSANGVSTQRLLPKRLTSQSGFWYCRAYSLEHAEERTYRVDRFEAVEPMEAPAEAVPLEAALPYDHPSHPEVIVRLTGVGVMHVERDPRLGHAIRLEEGGGVWQFRCPPSDLDWAAHFLLSLGPHAEVLAPSELKARLLQTARETLERYEEK